MSRTPNQMDYASSWETAGTGNPAIQRFFNSVYAWMCAGMALTAVTAFVTAQWAKGILASGNTAALKSAGGVFIGLFIAELVLVVVISRATQKLNTAMATGLFLLYAAINGVTLCGIFLVYAHSALASAFVVCAGTFGAVSAWGYFTKRDLSGLGHLLYMALFGIIIASIATLFFHSSAIEVAINYVGVLLFVGLTAYDTQKLKVIAEQTQDNPALAARLSVVGSLVLYLDFLNLFLFILELMNDRRS